MGIQENYNQEVTTSDIAKLSHELIYRRYLLNNNRTRSFFQTISIPEYLALHLIAKTGQENEQSSGRAYLQDIADKMHRTVRQTSRMAKALQERGMLVWSHDGDGSEGTYVALTESGRKMLQEEEDVLKTYYGKVIESYGRENVIQLLTMMQQMETVMRTVAEGEKSEGMEEDSIDRNDDNE